MRSDRFVGIFFGRPQTPKTSERSLRRSPKGDDQPKPRCCLLRAQAVHHLFTVCGCQAPPRGVLTFRLVSSLAIRRME